MSRYQARKVSGQWSVIDNSTREVLPRDNSMRVDAHALAEVLNSLEDQQDWDVEADLADTSPSLQKKEISNGSQ